MVENNEVAPMPQKQQKGPGAFELFSRFTQLRQAGANRDDAWYQVCDSVPDLTEVTRNAFLALAKDWERREGHKYRYQEGGKHETLPGTEVSVTEQVADQAQQANNKPQPQIQSSAVRAQKAALTGHLDPGSLSAYNQQRLEQILDQIDDNDVRSGDDQLPSRQSTPARPQTPVRPQPDNDSGTTPMRHPSDYFGPNTVMLAYFKNFPHPLRVTIVGNDELFIGRATSNSAMSPDIDLNPVNAGNYGVSRMHAVITRRENKLLIADLESMNYTYVNGMRLLPEEYYVLKDGDEIWFGQLHCQVRFQHK